MIHRILILITTPLIALTLVACSTNPKEAPEGYEYVTFPSGNGSVKLQAYLMRADSEKRPVVIMLSGSNGIWSVKDSGRFGPPISMFANLINHRDWNVITIDSFRSRGILHETCLGEYRADDIRGAITWIKKQPELNSKKIALMGFSDGATAILDVLNTAEGEKSPDIAAAIAHYPIAAPFLGKHDRRWKRSIPSAYRIEKPLLLTVGSDDNLVSPQDVEELAQNLKKQNAPITFKFYIGSGHGYWTRRGTRYGPSGSVNIGSLNGDIIVDSKEDVIGFLYNHLENE